MEVDESAFDVNPIVKDLLGAGGRVFQVEGYMGPSNRDLVNFYQDLSLTRYLEIPKKEIIRIMKLPEAADGRCKIFLRTTAELRVITVTSLKGDDILSALATTSAGNEPGTISRVNPPDNCGGRCEMSYRTCVQSHGGDFWCAVAYAGCILSCTFSSDVLMNGGFIG